jgi:hypothetical protein
MDKAVFDEYVAKRYQKQMEYYSNVSAKNQKKYKLLCHPMCYHIKLINTAIIKFL